MSSQTLHTSLLRPAIIHIIRAAGFHSTRPSVLDTLTDLAARYLLLLAERTAFYAYDRTSSSPDSPSLNPSMLTFPLLSSPSPTISDVRLAFSSISFFNSTLTASEEAWRETLRKPLSSFPPGAREKERRRRHAEDTRDIKEFIDWATGRTNREIRRIAGVLSDAQETGSLSAPEMITSVTAGLVAVEPKEDYVTVLKKKHSKTGEGARYAGTVVGKMAEEKGLIKIEGGPETLSAWRTTINSKRYDHESTEALTRKKPRMLVGGDLASTPGWIEPST